MVHQVTTRKFVRGAGGVPLPSSSTVTRMLSPTAGLPPAEPPGPPPDLVETRETVTVGITCMQSVVRTWARVVVLPPVHTSRFVHCVDVKR